MNGLLCRLAQYDREQDWATLISQYGAFIRKACRLHLPDETWLDDAVQETLLSLRQDLGRYHAGTDAEAKAWLHLIAEHRARNLANSESARHRREGSTDKFEHSDDSAEDLAEQKEHLIQALATLSPDQCVLIRLRYVEGLSFEEIGRRLGMSPSAAQRQGHRILQRLRAMLMPSQRKQQAGFLGLLTLLSSPDLPKAAGMPASGKTSARLSWPGKALLCGLTVTVAGGAWWWVAKGVSTTDQASPPPLAQPAPAAATTQPLDAASSRSAALALDLIQRFKARHPDWRLTDYGQRLNDPRLWRVEGGQNQVNAAGTAIELRLANPGDGIHGTRLSLVPGFAVDTQPHLLIARAKMRLRTLRTGIQVAAQWSPPVDGWTGCSRNSSLSLELLQRYLREEDAPPSPEYPDGFHVGILMDREGCDFLKIDNIEFSSPKLSVAVQHKTGFFKVALLCRRCPEPQTCLISEVQVYAAGRPTGVGAP